MSASKSHYTTSVQKGRPAYDVNTKSALAILSSGIAVAQANTFLATLNVPPMSGRSTKKREREIGPVVEQVADASALHQWSSMLDAANSVTVKVLYFIFRNNQRVAEKATLARSSLALYSLFQKKKKE